MVHQALSAIIVALSLLHTLLSIFIAFPTSIFFPFGRAMYWTEKFWSGGLLRLARARVHVKGLENIEPGRHYIFVSNHQSLYDIPLMMKYTPRQLRMIYKKELLWAPFLGVTLMIMRFISIDRGNREKAIQSLKKAAKKIHDGINIVIYAEGTRSLDGQISPFKKGAFLLAIDAQVPIIPVTISGTIQIMHKYRSVFDMGFRKEIFLTFDKPVPTAGLTAAQRDELKNKVETIIRDNFEPVKAYSLITDESFIRKMQEKKKAYNQTKKT